MVRRTLFTDDFNRADNTDIGAVWDNAYTAATSLQIVNQRIRAASVTPEAHESVNTVGPLADQWAQITLTSFTGAAYLLSGVILRVNAGGQPIDGYFLVAARNHPSGYTSLIIELTDGTGSLVATESATTWLSGDVLRGEVQGSSLRIYRNGTLLLSGVNAVHAAGFAGIDQYVDTGGSLADNEIDDFSCGDFEGSVLWLPQGSTGAWGTPQVIASGMGN